MFYLAHNKMIRVDESEDENYHQPSVATGYSKAELTDKLVKGSPVNVQSDLVI